ncbi:MAG: GNAT family N-acetyltransferase [Raoultibacter sp.]|jgi:hypothetical protein
MELPGLIRVRPEETELIDELSNMMGESFLEEGWTQVWLSALDAIGINNQRKLEISRAIIKCNFTIGAPHNCVYMLPDKSAATGAYLSSDLGGRTWGALEDESMENMRREYLSEEESRILGERMHEMGFISNFSWMLEDAQENDFLHFFAIGVDTQKRGSGSFRRLMTPFFDFADSKGLKCYLECYSDKTEGIYSHHGFETVKRFSDPIFDVTERCMIRYPRV